MGTSRGKRDEITLKLCSFNSAQLGFALFGWVQRAEPLKNAAPWCSHSLGEKPDPATQSLLREQGEAVRAEV